MNKPGDVITYKNVDGTEEMLVAVKSDDGPCDGCVGEGTGELGVCGRLPAYCPGFVWKEGVS